MPTAKTPLLLPANPTQPLEAATKQYVDAAAASGGHFGFLTIEHITASVNIPSSNAHSVATVTVTGVVGLNVGDFILFMNKATPHRPFIIRASPVCLVAGQFDVECYNADTSTADPAADTFHFLVFHI
jgi:hypothetical protein